MIMMVGTVDLQGTHPIEVVVIILPIGHHMVVGQEGIGQGLLVVLQIGAMAVVQMDMPGKHDVGYIL